MFILVNVISEIYNKKDKIIKKQLYITLLKYLGIAISIMFLSWIILDILYEIIYLIWFIYIGFFINVFLFCFFYKLIVRFASLSPLFSKIFVFIIPLIITIYSLINAHITEYREETLIFPGFSNSIKIMHIFDMHLGTIYQKDSVEKLVKIVNEKGPDVVAIIGDLSDGSEKVSSEWLEPFNQKTQVLYVTGNHEGLYGKKEILNTHGGQIFPFNIFAWLANTYFCGLYNYNNFLDYNLLHYFCFVILHSLFFGPEY